MNIESQVVGQLKSVEHDEAFFESVPFEIPYFDNQMITIGFVEAKYQPYLDSADNVLRKFLALTSKDRISNSELVFKYYDQTLKFGYTNNLHIKTPSDIWNHVRANEIIINWDENGDFYLCVSCRCDWEEEHGLQLVFKDGQNLIRASGHDGHFTD
jgi:hypothetical protein